MANPNVKVVKPGITRNAKVTQIYEGTNEIVTGEGKAFAAGADIAELEFNFIS